MRKYKPNLNSRTNPNLQMGINQVIVCGLALWVLAQGVGWVLKTLNKPQGEPAETISYRV